RYEGPPQASYLAHTLPGEIYASNHDRNAIIGRPLPRLPRLANAGGWLHHEVRQLRGTGKWRASKTISSPKWRLGFLQTSPTPKASTALPMRAGRLRSGTR